ncbi:hypothetical protein F4680DRAFT_465459 [Xylaria scruposa]|nr:hypothetical protein F4680DRAFT_465459 [Xylaria scruposa]
MLPKQIQGEIIVNIRDPLTVANLRAMNPRDRRGKAEELLRELAHCSGPFGRSYLPFDESHQFHSEIVRFPVLELLGKCMEEVGFPAITLDHMERWANPDGTFGPGTQAHDDSHRSGDEGAGYGG